MDLSASSRGKQRAVTPQEQSKSRSASPTEYAFITSTGKRTLAGDRQALREVRSHVMKRHLRRQQYKSGPSREALPLAGGHDCEGMMPVPSHPSSYRSTDSYPVGGTQRGGSRVKIGTLFPGFTTLNPYYDSQMSIGAHGVQESFATGSRSKRFGLDFGWSPWPPCEVSASAHSYVASAIRDKITGAIEPSWETLSSKGEAVRLVMDILATRGNDVPTSVVHAVSLLAVGCALENETAEVQGHLHALGQIVQTHGVVGSFDFDIQRAFTWNAYCVAAALQLSPIFPPPIYGRVDPFPLAFLDDARIRAWRTIKKLPKDSSFLFDSIIRLHQIGLATSKDWYSDVDQGALSNLYFEALQNVCTIQIDEPWNSTAAGGSQGQETALMFKVFSIGMAMFIWGTIRHVMKRLGHTVIQYTYNNAFTRLKGLLEGPGGYHAWPRGKSLEPVLATLVYCLDSCEHHHPWRVWFMNASQKSVDMMNIKSAEKLRKILRNYPSSDEYEVAADRLWREISTSGFAAVPDIGFSGSQ
ncbi:hypothetical protein GQ43DRAFT_437840 [Delitschia confertaspora ATCC 74209]|uniref:Transcription factor domain-containing protein n=1 Tax=Delitschia confertaspora ATCC 74209 TaxID=1513339 RepID=A0A9P4JW45_9PLEO|nr:hypothetical protein GQ43DRAFT_437840 [Delitschia confertaspora ATCC 74209]